MVYTVIQEHMGKLVCKALTLPTLASSAAQDFFIRTMAAIAHLQH